MPGMPLNCRRIHYKHTVSTQKDSYYRIKIIDIDGSVKYSSTAFIPADKNIPVFRVYPNPASAEVFVSLSVTEEQAARYIIYDMNGSRVAMKNIKLSRGSQEIKIDISAFASGSYRLVLEYNGLKKSTTIIKK